MNMNNNFIFQTNRMTKSQPYSLTANVIIIRNKNLDRSFSCMRECMRETLTALFFTCAYVCFV